MPVQGLQQAPSATHEGAALPRLLGQGHQQGRGVCPPGTQGAGLKVTEKYEWDTADARRMWCFGPASASPIILPDVTKSMQDQDSVAASFQVATGQGRHRAAHVGRALRIPRATAARVSIQSITALPLHRVLTASPGLRSTSASGDPVFATRVWCHLRGPEQEAGPRVRGVPGGRHPHVCREGPSTSLSDFTADLRAHTGGQAFPLRAPPDPVRRLLRPHQAPQTGRGGDTCKHKRLKEGVPVPDNFRDRT